MRGGNPLTSSTGERICPVLRSLAHSRLSSNHFGIRHGRLCVCAWQMLSTVGNELLQFHMATALYHARFCVLPRHGHHPDFACSLSTCCFCCDGCLCDRIGLTELSMDLDAWTDRNLCMDHACEAQQQLKRDSPTHQRQPRYQPQLQQSRSCGGGGGGGCSSCGWGYDAGTAAGVWLAVVCGVFDS